MNLTAFNALSPQQQASTFIHEFFPRNKIVWTTCYPQNPNSKHAEWGGIGHKLNCAEFSVDLNGKNNAYYSTAAFKTSAARTIENASLVTIIFLDDVKENDYGGFDLPLAPSFVIETSAGNFQAGYAVLDGDDIRAARGVIRSIAQRAGKANDPNGNNPVRYGRLPGGINTKPGANKFQSKMVLWKPERRYTLVQLAEVFGVEEDTVDVDYTGASDSFGGYNSDEVRSLLAFTNEPGRSDSWGKYASGVSKSVDGYDFFRDMVFALHESGVPEAKELGLEWANNRDKADGGKAFLKTWRAADKNEAKKGRRITLRTFFGYAAAEGWSYTGPISNEPPYVPETPTGHPQQKWFPLIKVAPPLMRDLVHHALQCAPYPHPIFAVFSVIFLFSALANRLVRIGPKFWLNMYIHFLGGSTCGKDMFLKYPRRLIEQINPLSIHCTSADVGSAVGLQESLMLEGKGGLVIFKDEDSSAKMQPGENEKITNLENRYFTSTGETEAWRKLKRAPGGVTPPDAHCLFYSKLSASTIAGHFGADDVVGQMKSGAAGRKQLVPTNMVKPIYNPESLHTNEFGMLEAVAGWYDKLVGRVLNNQFIDLNVIDSDKDMWKTWSPEVIEITPEVEAHLHEMILEFDDKFRNTENEVVRLFYGRNNEHVIKIAGAIALAEDPCVEALTIGHLDLAKQIIDLLLETTLPTVIKHAVEDESVKDAEKIRSSMVCALKNRKARYVEAVEKYKEQPSVNAKRGMLFREIVKDHKIIPRALIMQNTSIGSKRLDAALLTLVGRGEASKAEPPEKLKLECYKLI